MLIDLSKVRAEKAPQFTLLYTCSNWKFYIWDNGNITLEYKREVNQLELISLNEEIETTERELEKAKYKEEIEELKSKLNRLEKEYQYKASPTAKRLVMKIFSANVIQARLDLAKDSKDPDNCWSVLWTLWKPSNEETIENPNPLHEDRREFID